MSVKFSLSNDAIIVFLSSDYCSAVSAWILQATETLSKKLHL